MYYQNPVIPGFYPDPSICRVGHDYYLVNSSFEYFPGVPLFHSQDLVHWDQIGHCLTRKNQLDLTNISASDGIWAPTIRFFNDRFYMVTTNVRRKPWNARNFFVYTDNPGGEWSDPVWLDEGGIDPDLFFDDDGTCYYLRNGANGIYTRIVDIATGNLKTESKHIWTGTGGPFPEAPHLYKINDTYYLIIAEGGTGSRHMATVARSDTPFGPYESLPHNPILTHYYREHHPIQSTGHGDIFQDHNGQWWIVFLGTRPVFDGKVQYQHLGRETFLAPVGWHHDGWPAVNSGCGVELGMDAPLPSLQSPIPTSPRDNFDTPSLGLQWNFLRNPSEESWSLKDRPGWLRLQGYAVSLDDQGSPAMVCRRQQHFFCKGRTLMKWTPAGPNEEAGITIRMNERYHYDLYVTLSNNQPCIILRSCIDKQSTIISQQEVSVDTIELSLTADPSNYSYYWNSPGEEPKMIGSTPVRPLSQQVAGGFTGVYWGMYASGNGKRCLRPAYFDWFDYEGI